MLACDRSLVRLYAPCPLDLLASLYITYLVLPRRRGQLEDVGGPIAQGVRPQHQNRLAASGSARRRKIDVGRVDGPKQPTKEQAARGWYLYVHVYIYIRRDYSP